jgi:hypothetical protein
MATQTLNRLKRKILFSSNGISSTVKNSYMCQVVCIELGELKEQEKIAALETIEFNLDQRTEKYDTLMHDLIRECRMKELLRQQVMWHV